MVDKYPKEAQNPPFQPEARPEDQPPPRQRVPKEAGESDEQHGGPIAPDEREPGSYTKDEVVAHVLEPFRDKESKE